MKAQEMLISRAEIKNSMNSTFLFYKECEEKKIR